MDRAPRSEEIRDAEVSNRDETAIDNAEMEKEDSQETSDREEEEEEDDFEENRESAKEEESSQELQQAIKRSAIASIYRDSTLCAAEKQKRIQAVLRGVSLQSFDAKNDAKKCGDKNSNHGNEAANGSVTSQNGNSNRPPPSPAAPSFYSARDALTSAIAGANVKQLFGCAHFKRDLYLLAPCCNKWYVCRVCHDEQEDHVMDRANIAMQCCMHCMQVTNVGACCTSAVCNGRSLAHYYCDKCHTHRKETDLLFWHCDKCGMCRAGSPKLRYQHCDRCNLCYPVDGETQHQCLQSSSESQSCPICSQNIQSSPKPVMALRCGHGIHIECLQSLCAQREISAMRCPLCKQSINDMSDVWVEMDSVISSTVMPEPERYWTARIGCNDCRTHTEAAPFHYYGLKCGNTSCGSYNTYLEHLNKNEPPLLSPPASLSLLASNTVPNANSTANSTTHDSVDTTNGMQNEEE